MTAVSYTFANSSTEIERLEALGATLEGFTRDLVASLAIPEGARVLDCGAGTGTMSRAIAALRPDLEIVAFDENPDFVAYARAHAHARAGAEVRPRLSYRVGDVRAIDLDAASFDVVVCRFVLMHLADPARALAEMVRVARPGGLVVAVESDWAGQILHPMTERDEELRRMSEILATRLGMDPFLGRKLFGLLSASGLRDVDVRAVSDVSTAKTPHVAAEKLAHRARIIRQFKPMIIAAGMMPEADLDACLRRLDELPTDPAFFATEMRVIARGRKERV